MDLLATTEGAHLEPSHISKMELIAEIVNSPKFTDRNFL